MIRHLRRKSMIIICKCLRNKRQNLNEKKCWKRNARRRIDVIIIPNLFSLSFSLLLVNLHLKAKRSTKTSVWASVSFRSTRWPTDRNRLVEIKALQIMNRSSHRNSRVLRVDIKSFVGKSNNFSKRRRNRTTKSRRNEFFLRVTTFSLIVVSVEKKLLLLLLLFSSIRTSRGDEVDFDRTRVHRFIVHATFSVNHLFTNIRWQITFCQWTFEWTSSAAITND